jgi:hypothetical protein
MYVLQSTAALLLFLPSELGGKITGGGGSGKIADSDEVGVTGSPKLTK